MTSIQHTLPVAGGVPAVLTLPLTPRALRDLDQAVSGSLGVLLRGMYRDTAADALLPADAGAVEYASWMPDPGAVEMASWSASLRSARQ
jgi:hypothetical protein